MQKPEEVMRQDMTSYISAYGAISSGDVMLKHSIARHILNYIIAILKKRGMDEDVEEKLQELDEELNQAVRDYYDGQADPNWKDTLIRVDRVMRDCVSIAHEHDLISPKAVFIDPLKLITAHAKEG